MIMKTRSLFLSLPLFADLPIISLPAYRRLGISPVVFLAGEAARKEWNEVAAARALPPGRRRGGGGQAGGDEGERGPQPLASFHHDTSHPAAAAMEERMRIARDIITCMAKPLACSLACSLTRSLTRSLSLSLSG